MFTVLFAGLLLAATVAACGGGRGASAGTGCDGKVASGTRLKAWWHFGVEAEAKAMRAMVKAFNASQSEVTVDLVLVPEATYGEELDGAVAAGQVPDLVDTDASKAFRYAWAGALQPIDGCASDELLADLLPSVLDQGTYAGKLWAVGMFDAGMGMFASRKALAKVGARVPTSVQDAWTAGEFTDLLGDLQAAGYAHPLDLKINYGHSEWYTYGFSPIVWSAGGDLVDRSDYATSRGVLDRPEVVDALTIFQSWFQRGFVDTNADDLAFASGRSALSWVGSWQWESYEKALGEDLVLVPLPDFGEGPRTGQGSWQWAVGSNTDADAAWRFIEFTLSPDNQRAFAETSLVVPARQSVAESMENFAPGGPLRLYLDQLLDGTSLSRPPHPAYAAMSAIFAQAIADIMAGADVGETLRDAAAAIEADNVANKGFPPPR